MPNLFINLSASEGNMNLSFIISDSYGRSEPTKDTFRLTSDNQLTMFQSYAGKLITLQSLQISWFFNGI